MKRRQLDFLYWWRCFTSHPRVFFTSKTSSRESQVFNPPVEIAPLEVLGVADPLLIILSIAWAKVWKAPTQILSNAFHEVLSLNTEWILLTGFIRAKSNSTYKYVLFYTYFYSYYDFTTILTLIYYTHLFLYNLHYMESHAMKLPAFSFCTNVDIRWGAQHLVTFTLTVDHRISRREEIPLIDMLQQ